MQRNGWFVAAGVLSCIGAVMTGIYSISMFGVATGVSQEATSEGAEVTTGVIVAFGIVLLLCCAVSIFCAWVFFKNSTKSHAELRKKSALIITAIVLSFLFSGILSGVLALVGYSNQGTFTGGYGQKNGGDAQQQNQNGGWGAGGWNANGAGSDSNSENEEKNENESASFEHGGFSGGIFGKAQNVGEAEGIEEKLKRLKKMRDNGMISEEEYQKMREDVLSKF